MTHTRKISLSFTFTTVVIECKMPILPVCLFIYIYIYCIWIKNLFIFLAWRPCPSDWNISMFTVQKRGIYIRNFQVGTPQHILSLQYFWGKNIFCQLIVILVVSFSIPLLNPRTILLANNVQVMSKEVAPNYTASDVSKIKKFSRNKRVCTVLAQMLS